MLREMRYDPGKGQRREFRLEKRREWRGGEMLTIGIPGVDFDEEPDWVSEATHRWVSAGERLLEE